MFDSGTHVYIFSHNTFEVIWEMYFSMVKYFQGNMILDYILYRDKGKWKSCSFFSYERGKKYQKVMWDFVYANYMNLNHG